MTGIIFDLDGTLIESAPAICDITNRFMDKRGLPPLSVEETRGYIGNGAARLLELALQARKAFQEDAFASDLEVFQELYAAAPPEANIPMPGCREAMETLSASGHRLALCTNKPMAPTRALIDAMGWSELLGVIVAGDSLPERKPHPAPLLKAASDLNQDHAIYIGDSEVDAATAEAAGLPFILYTAGYRKAPVDALRHTAAFDSFEQLPALVDTLLARA